VATVSRLWLRGELARLAQAQVFVDRVVPAAWPDDPPHGHFAESDDPATAEAGDVSLTWSHAEGVATMRLGGLARALVPLPAPQGTRWTATPGAATAAERWLGAPVAVLPPAQRLLQAARTLWNLRQFDLARRSRGSRAVMDALRQLAGRDWRPARIGLAVLVLAHIVGLNLWALHLRGSIEAKREAAEAVVKATFPRVNENDVKRAMRLVMQREVDALRLVAGKPAETDFEPMLQAAALAWPSDQPPAESLRYEPGKLSIGIARWGEPQIAQFRSTLQPLGWRVDATSDGRVVLTRGEAGGAR
jgi:general secretion pathway protein L